MEKLDQIVTFINNQPGRMADAKLILSFLGYEISQKNIDYLREIVSIYDDVFYLKGDNDYFTVYLF